MDIIGNVLGKRRCRRCRQYHDCDEPCNVDGDAFMGRWNDGHY